MVAFDADAVSVGYVFDVAALALGQQQAEDGVGGVVAEELAEGLFVVGDVVFADEFEEVLRSVERQRGFGEVGIGGEEAAGLAVDVGEVAAASAGDEDFASWQAAVVEQGDTASALACDGGAHEAGGSGTEDDYVEASGWGAQLVSADTGGGN
jgi:hypothetical protein